MTFAGAPFTGGSGGSCVAVGNSFTGFAGTPVGVFTVVWDTSTVRVLTRNSAGAAYDAGFNLVVSC